MTTVNSGLKIGRLLVMLYSNCIAEPTIIRRVLRDILQNNGYCNLDNESENVN